MLIHLIILSSHVAIIEKYLLNAYGHRHSVKNFIHMVSFNLHDNLWGWHYYYSYFTDGG